MLEMVQAKGLLEDFLLAIDNDDVRGVRILLLKAEVSREMIDWVLKEMRDPS